MSHPPVLVLGLGNTLLRDDGVGFALLTELSKQCVAGGIDFVDGGTQGLALLNVLGGRKRLLILDAVELGHAPGTIHFFCNEEIAGIAGSSATSAHEANAGDLLAAASLLGDLPDEVVVIGIEPEIVHTGSELSESVREAIPAAVRLARAVLEQQ